MDVQYEAGGAPVRRTSRTTRWVLIGCVLIAVVVTLGLVARRMLGYDPQFSWRNEASR